MAATSLGMAHNRAYQRRRRSKPRRFSVDAGLAETVAGRLARRWWPAQISRWLRRRYRRRRSWHVCAETIYEARRSFQHEPESAAHRGQDLTAMTASLAP
jgi:IS30 family transposase